MWQRAATQAVVIIERANFDLRLRRRRSYRPLPKGRFTTTASPGLPGVTIPITPWPVHQSNWQVMLTACGGHPGEVRWTSDCRHSMVCDLFLSGSNEQALPRGQAARPHAGPTTDVPKKFFLALWDGLGLD